MYQHLGSWRTTWNVNVNRNDLVDTLDNGVVIKNTTGRRASAHRDNPLRLRHLVVNPAQHRRHLARYATGDDHHVSLSRARTKYLSTKTRQIVSRRGRVHHFDRAASESKSRRPQRRLPRPVNERVEPRGQNLRQSFCNYIFETHLELPYAAVRRLLSSRSANALASASASRRAFSLQSNAPFLTT